MDPHRMPNETTPTIDAMFDMFEIVWRTLPSPGHILLFAWESYAQHWLGLMRLSRWVDSFTRQSCFMSVALHSSNGNDVTRFFSSGCTVSPICKKKGKVWSKLKTSKMKEIQNSSINSNPTHFRQHWVMWWSFPIPWQQVRRSATHQLNRFADMPVEWCLCIQLFRQGEKVQYHFVL